MAERYPRIASDLLSVLVHLDTFAKSACHKQPNSLSRQLAAFSHEPLNLRIVI